MKNNDRFETVHEEGSILKNAGVRRIIVDKETGVHYLVVATASSSSVTPLLGADGKPIVSRID